MQYIHGYLGMRVSMYDEAGNYVDDAIIMAHAIQFNDGRSIVGLLRNDGSPGGFDDEADTDQLKYFNNPSREVIAKLWQCDLYALNTHLEKIYGCDCSTGYLTLAGCLDTRITLISNNEFDFSYINFKEANNMKLSSSDKLLVKLYYSKKGQRMLDIQVPSFIEDELKQGATETVSSTAEGGGSKKAKIMTSKSWKDIDGNGLKLYKRIKNMNGNSYVVNMINKNNYQVDSVGNNFGIRNLSILRAVGIGREVISWDISSIKILDEDVLKWADNLNKSIVSYIKSNLAEKRKRFKIETVFIEL